MPHYLIDSAASRVLVIARSSLHDTELRVGGVRGQVEGDVALLASDGARAEIEVDMSSADAGDFLKNRKLRSHLDLEAHPTARFVLDGLEGVEDDGAGLRARIAGTLSWRGRALAVVAIGEGSVTDRDLDVTARFDLELGDLGITPPRMLMFKIEETVSVEVKLRARAS